MKLDPGLRTTALVALLSFGAMSTRLLSAQMVPGVSTSLDLRCPDSIQVECPSDVPFPAETLAEFVEQGGSYTKGDCSGRLFFKHVEDRSEGTCPTVITRVYQLADRCGNVQTCEQTITVFDQTPPHFTGPLGGAIECNEPFKLIVQAEDNCGRPQFAATIVGGPGEAGATLIDLGNGSFELTLTSGYVEIAFTISDTCNSVTEIARIDTDCEPAAALEGCSHGFWKNHTELWDAGSDAIATLAGFTTSTGFNAYFGISAAQSILPDSATMLDALKKGGGTPDGSQLARDGVAALLNIAAGLNYEFPGGIADAPALKDAITGAYVNQAFSPLSGDLGDANENEGSFCD